MLHSTDVLSDWERGNVITIYKEGKKKKNPGNYMQSVQLLPDKIMEQILLENVLWYMENREMIGNSQHGKVVNCVLTNLMAFY